MLWDDEPLGREGDLVLAADQSLFERSGLSYEQAIFWIDPVNWAQAPSSVRSEIRAVLNIDRPAAASPPSAAPAGRVLSHRSLVAYAMLQALSLARLGALWDAHLRESEPGPAARRAETVTMKIEDWAELDRRL
ncbi:hypothetical protein [Microbacterium aurum]